MLKNMLHICLRFAEHVELATLILFDHISLTGDRCSVNLKQRSTHNLRSRHKNQLTSAATRCRTAYLDIAISDARLPS
jgi:hypothetical protein